MSKNNAIRHELRQASKESDERCITCKWYLMSTDSKGHCKNFHIEVEDNQVCNQYMQGFIGENQNLIREYQQNLLASKPFKGHPKAHIPSPTAEDYDLNYTQRYFVKYKSSIKNPITEVDEKSFKSINDIFYYKCEIKWKISGPEKTIKKDGAVIDKGIADANKDIIKLKERTFRGIKDYLTDYTELAYKKVPKSDVNSRSSKKKKRKSVYGSGIRPPIK